MRTFGWVALDRYENGVDTLAYGWSRQEAEAEARALALENGSELGEVECVEATSGVMFTSNPTPDFVVVEVDGKKVAALKSEVPG